LPITDFIGKKGGPMTARTLFYALLIALLVPLIACNLQIGNTSSTESDQPDIETPEGAREKLSQLNIPYTIDDFVKCARESDAVAVELFLTAGMNPDAKDSRGVTALEAATQAGHSDVITLFEDFDEEEE